MFVQVLISVGDKSRLSPYEYLNDNLVDFYLRFMLREKKIIPDTRPKTFDFKQQSQPKVDSSKPTKRRRRSCVLDDDADEEDGLKTVISVDSQESKPSPLEGMMDEEDEASCELLLRSQSCDLLENASSADSFGNTEDNSLKRPVSELLSEVKVSQVHIFSSHFYGQLSDFSGSKSTRKQGANHYNVQKWTKDFDIFSKR